MKILLMPSSYAPNIGGVERVTERLASELRRRGHGVRVVVPRWPSILPEHEVRDETEIARFQMPLPSRHLWRFTRGFFKAVRAISAECMNSQADLIHVHCLGPNALYALIASRLHRLPLVVTTHGELQGDDSKLRHSRLMRTIRRATFRGATWVTAPSEFTLSQVPLGPATGATVVYNAVDMSSVRDPGVRTSTPFVFCAARLAHNKGLDVAIRGFAAARPYLGREELWIAGSGREGARLQALISELGVGAYVKLLGPLSPSVVQDLMSGCLFYLCPSRNEAFGLSLLEAMAAGKTVLATRVGGIPELVEHGRTGLLVPPNDPASLSSSLTELARNSELRASLGAAAMERAQHFDWQSTLSGYLKIYQTVYGRGSAGRLRRQTTTAIDPDTA